MGDIEVNLITGVFLPIVRLALCSRENHFFVFSLHLLRMSHLNVGFSYHTSYLLITFCLLGVSFEFIKPDKLSLKLTLYIRTAIPTLHCSNG